METKLTPYGRDTALRDYMPLPRQILRMGLSSTAILLYAVLLDRGTLSQRTGQTDQRGQVYVVYPVEKLAGTVGKGGTTVKRCLEELEKAGLIQRKRAGRNCPSNIFLNLPGDQKQTVRETENGPSGRPKMGRVTDRKRSPINRRKQIDLNKYYRHSEDESL